MAYTLRQKLGAVLLDWPRYEYRLRWGWGRICNRAERLIPAPDGSGVRCDWQWTSDLHIANVYPSTGGRLMMRALADWPIGFGTPDVSGPAAEPAPEVSFIIGHRGAARLPHLLATLATIGAQRGVKFECIVVEQAQQAEIASQLPPWVTYVHNRVSSAELPYCRSWAFNIGARHARGSLLVFHDNDMLVPRDYAHALWRRFSMGYAAINLKRFIFYLGEADTDRIFASGKIERPTSSTVVMQNAEGGGSIGIGKEAFFSIGGFDEAFVGWGGEDSEFWERVQTLRIWEYTGMPIVHLWHPSQPAKAQRTNPTMHRYRERAAIPAAARIAELRNIAMGDPDTPPPWPHPVHLAAEPESCAE